MTVAGFMLMLYMMTPQADEPRWTLTGFYSGDHTALKQCMKEGPYGGAAKAHKASSVVQGFACIPVWEYKK